MNFYKISLPHWDYPLRDDINIVDYFGTEPGIKRYSTEILALPLLEDIARRGLHITEVQVFISPGPYVMKIHIDGVEFDRNHCAVNWVVSESTNWDMSWYEYTGDKLTGQENSAGTFYLQPAPEECRKLETVRWQGAGLVNVGVPHRIVNLSHSLRYCISVRFVPDGNSRDFDYVKSHLI